VADPILELNLAEAGITSIIWATGFAFDYSWLKVDAFDDAGRPKHQRGISAEPGIYFLGLPWQCSEDPRSSGASGTTPGFWRTIFPRNAST
jgi:putative flavoprotein involved in K+ transport